MEWLVVSFRRRTQIFNELADLQKIVLPQLVHQPVQLFFDRPGRNIP